jgi:hypothetical protein
LHLKRSDVDATVEHANKSGPALVVVRRRSEVRIACVDGRATRHEFMGKGWAAVILKWAEQGIGVDLVAGAGQETAAIIATDVVAMRGDRTA